MERKETMKMQVSEPIDFPWICIREEERKKDLQGVVVDEVRIVAHRMGVSHTRVASGEMLRSSTNESGYLEYLREQAVAAVVHETVKELLSSYGIKRDELLQLLYNLRRGIAVAEKEASRLFRQRDMQRVDVVLGQLVDLFLGTGLHKDKDDE